MNNREKFWNPEVNDEIEGILVDKLCDVGRYNSKLYKIHCEEGEILVWGKTQLDALMDLTEIGDKILLRYVGLELVNEKKKKKFELEILDG